MKNQVCTPCIQAAEDENWSASTGGEPADLCMSLGAQMDAHDCAGSLALHQCACAYTHDGGLMGNDPIQVLELGRKYVKNHGLNAIAAEGMNRAICRALALLSRTAEERPKTEEQKPNTDNLEGIRCPKCGSYEPFYITFEATYTVFDKGIPSEHGNYGWKRDCDIVCGTCQHKGVVGEFQQHPTAGAITHLEGEEGKGRTMPVYPFLWPHQPARPKSSSLTVTIQADAHSDDQAVYIKFDALAWFREVSAENILALAQCGWGGDYPADTVVLYTRNNENEKRLFSYLHIHPKMGFECHVNEESAMAWLADNRPEVHDLIQRECPS